MLIVSIILLAYSGITFDADAVDPGALQSVMENGGRAQCFSRVAPQPMPGWQIPPASGWVALNSGHSPVRSETIPIPDPASHGAGRSHKPGSRTGRYAYQVPVSQEQA